MYKFFPRKTFTFSFVKEKDINRAIQPALADCHVCYGYWCEGQKDNTPVSVGGKWLQQSPYSCYSKESMALCSI